MLIAVDNENRKLIIGLQEENIKRLLNDMPIERKLKETPGVIENVPELVGWTLYILGPEDVERFVARVQGTK